MLGLASDAGGPKGTSVSIGMARVSSVRPHSSQLCSRLTSASVRLPVCAVPISACPYGQLVHTAIVPISESGAQGSHIFRAVDGELARACVDVRGRRLVDKAQLPQLSLLCVLPLRPYKSCDTARPLSLGTVGAKGQSWLWLGDRWQHVSVCCGNSFDDFETKVAVSGLCSNLT